MSSSGQSSWSGCVRGGGLGAKMMAINGRIQREGEVVHLVARQLFDLSADLRNLAERDGAFRPLTVRAPADGLAGARTNHPAISAN